MSLLDLFPASSDREADAVKEILRLRETLAKVRGLINRDRTGLACALSGVQEVVRGYDWLRRDEWGSYDYTERTQATLRLEIGACLGLIQELATRALRESGNRADHAYRPSEPDREREIDGLRAESATLREALQPFAEYGNWLAEHGPEAFSALRHPVHEDFMRARATRKVRP